MDEFKKVCEGLVQLSKFTIGGKLDDAEAFLRRLAYANRRSDAMVWLELNKLVAANASVRGAPAHKMVERESKTVFAPQDNDSQLDLLARDIPPIDLAVTPIYAEKTQKVLDRIVGEYGKRESLEAMGLFPSTKLIFSGAPGVGKTLAAKWMANELKIPLYTLNLAAVMSSYLGKTGNNIRRVFEFASKSPCILLLDEFDAIAKKRDDDSDVGELKRLVTVLLQEIDNFSTSSMLIAATNHPDLLDPAVWRRFEVRIGFEMPDDADVRGAIKSFMGKDYGEVAEFELPLSLALGGKSYSEIRRVILSIRKDAIIRDVGVYVSVRDWLLANCADLKKSERKRLAVSLVERGCGQREAQRLTGVSRDTIRTAILRKNGGEP